MFAKNLLAVLIVVTYSMFNNSYAQSNDSENKLSCSHALAATHKINIVTNPHTGNYDIKYHRLELTVNPNNSTVNLSGIVTTKWVALTAMNQIVFDLKSNMSVSGVTQRGNPLSFSQANDELTIQLPTTQGVGVLDSLSVNYSGTPSSGGFGYFNRSTHNGVPIVWTLSEPYGAMYWWPCKNDLIDKADSVDIIVTHPRYYTGSTEYKTAANGVLVSETISGTNKITHWHHGFPIPAYLVAFAITNYTSYTDWAYQGTAQQFPILNYVYPENLSYSQANTPITADLMEIFGNLFEMYPYASEKYGHAQFPWGGGMEHTTMTFMVSFGRSLISHELAHQWFGDKVTCGSWADIWLNEGFATYLEALSTEAIDGSTAFKNWRINSIQTITSSAGGSVYVTDTTSVNRIFDGRLSYQKGAMLLHMLRYKLGATNFFQALRNYLADPQIAFKYARTSQLINHLELQSGQDVDEFFNDWFTGQGFPSYQLKWNQTGNQIMITVSQTQSHSSVSFFEMPLPVKLTGTGGQVQWLRLENTTNGQVFVENVPFTVSNVEFDPDYEIISKNNSVILSTSTVELEADYSIANPIGNVITIKSNGYSQCKAIKIYNASGQCVLSQNYSGENINVSGWSDGAYFLQLFTDKGTLYKTLLKE